MVIVRTPFRISFFGGGTDYPSWYQEHGGAVLATTIDKYCYITCRYLPPFFEHKYRIVYSRIEIVKHFDEIEHPAVREILKLQDLDHGLEIHHDGDLPARSGLGSSSSFSVSLLHALTSLKGKQISKEELAKKAIHVEQNVIKECVGSQDQISAAYGGFNHIEFQSHSDTFRVVPFVANKQRFIELQDHLMLCFTGLSRIAAEVAQSKINNFKIKQVEMHLIRAMVDEAKQILSNPATSIEEFGKLLHQAWVYKRSLSEKVSTPHIDSLYEEALTAGAIGGKILGAGGGGFLLLFVKPHLQAQVREKLHNLIHVPFKFEESGSQLMLYQPSELS